MERYIINIMGPMAVGKTTVIRELLAYLPQYRTALIDNYRRDFSDGTPQGESLAWIEMLRYTEQVEFLIIESSGTSININSLISVLNSHTINIYLSAHVYVRTDRKQKREVQGYQNPPMYFESSVEWYFERPLVLKPDITFNTNEKQPYEVAAEIMEALPSEFI